MAKYVVANIKKLINIFGEIKTELEKNPEKTINGSVPVVVKLFPSTVITLVEFGDFVGNKLLAATTLLTVGAVLSIFIPVFALELHKPDLSHTLI